MAIVDILLHFKGLRNQNLTHTLPKCSSYRFFEEPKVTPVYICFHPFYTIVQCVHSELRIQILHSVVSTFRTWTVPSEIKRADGEVIYSAPPA